MNDISATIYYDTRIAISAPIEQPIVWRCTKVEQVSPKGISKLTFAQTRWNDNTDYIEKDEDGTILGIWCDYYKDKIEPEPQPIDIITSTRAEITYSGTKPEIKINGNYKKFTVTFYQDNEPLTFQHGDWKFTINDQDVSDLIEINTANLEENQIKIKFKADDSYIDKILDVTYTSFTGVQSKVQMHIVGI